MLGYIFHHPYTEHDLVSAIHLLGGCFVLGCAVLGGCAIYCCKLLRQERTNQTNA